jgi:beta-phosphoglucomutase-like phosphatase (HAD superfamily)
VIEDSRIGLRAAKAAGMTCVVTMSSYTQGEDFKGADAIYDCIGEENAKRFSLADLERMVAMKQSVQT